MITYTLSFISVVKAGSFSAAAQKTGVSKAQLSRHVTQLEALLGIQLLHRTTRSLALTEQGRQYFEACKSIEDNYAEAVHQLKQDFQAIQGTLKITAPIDFGIQFLPKIIETYTKKYPQMNVVLSLSNVNENIVEENYDVAIRIANRLPDSNLKMLTLMNFKRIFCAAPDYFKNRKTPKSPEDLKQYTCITSLNRNRSVIKPQWEFYKNNKPVKYTLENYIEVDSLIAQLELIKRGVGIGRLPDYFVQTALKSGELIEVFSNLQKPSSHAYLLYPDVVVLPRKTQAFIEEVKLYWRS